MFLLGQLYNRPFLLLHCAARSRRGCSRAPSSVTGLPCFAVHYRFSQGLGASLIDARRVFNWVCLRRQIFLKPYKRAVVEFLA